MRGVRAERVLGLGAMLAVTLAQGCNPAGDPACTGECGGAPQVLLTATVTSTPDTWSSDVTTPSLRLWGHIDRPALDELPAAVALTDDTGAAVPLTVDLQLLDAAGAPTTLVGSSAFGAVLSLSPKTAPKGWTRLTFMPPEGRTVWHVPDEGFRLAFDSRPSLRSVRRCVQPTGKTRVTVELTEAVDPKAWSPVSVDLDGATCPPVAGTASEREATYECPQSANPTVVRLAGSPFPVPPSGTAGQLVLATIGVGKPVDGCLGWTPETLEAVP